MLDRRTDGHDIFFGADSIAALRRRVNGAKDVPREQWTRRLGAWTRSPCDVVLVSFDRVTAGLGAEPAPTPGHVAAASASASLRLHIPAPERSRLLPSP